MFKIKNNFTSNACKYLQQRDYVIMKHACLNMSEFD
jgi:hypothetical protein